MGETVANPLTAWESFYVIVGSSAAALTGLQFVVIALVAESAQRRSSKDTIAAFATPNVVHFSASLLVSAVLSAPWHTLSPAGLAIAITGLAGAVYSAMVVARARRQRDYAPVFEDWLWHNILPTVAYATLVLAAMFLARSTEPSLFFIAGAALLLLFVGIHNSWDTVTYITFDLGDADRAESQRARSATAQPGDGPRADAPRQAAPTPTTAGVAEPGATLPPEKHSPSPSG